MTLAQQPAFASNEYVTRWLTTVEEMAENAHQQQSLFVSEGEDSASSPRRKHRNTFTDTDPRQQPGEKYRRDYKNAARLHAAEHQSRTADPLPDRDHDRSETFSESKRPARKNIQHEIHKPKRTLADPGQIEKNLGGKPNIRCDDSGARGIGIQDDEEEDASKKYEKRARRKTRPDRYDYKPEKTKKEVQISNKDSLRKHRSRKKTGELLSKDFHAPNIDSARITLAQGHGPGIFNTGKTSEAVVQRGIPDLTFSDMSFLRKKRKLDHVQSERKESRKESERTRITADEISRFFEESTDPRKSDSAHIAKILRSKRRATNLSPSQSSPAKLGHNKDDRADSFDAGRPQARSMISHGGSMVESHRPENSVTADAAHRGSLQKAYSKHQYSPIISQVSWSVTPSARLTRPVQQQQQQQPDVELPEGEQAFGNDVHGRPTLPPSNLPDSSDPHTISVSNPSVDQFTRGILLNKSMTVEKHPIVGAQVGSLTLDDLKDIARIPELCDRLDQNRHLRNLKEIRDHQNTQLEPREPSHTILVASTGDILPHSASREHERHQRCWSTVHECPSYAPGSPPVTDFSAARYRIMPQLWNDTVAMTRNLHSPRIRHSEHDFATSLSSSNQPVGFHVGTEVPRSTNTYVSQHDSSDNPAHAARPTNRMVQNLIANDNLYVVPRRREDILTPPDCQLEEFPYVGTEQDETEFADHEPWAELDDFDRRMLGLEPPKGYVPECQPHNTELEPEPSDLVDPIGTLSCSNRTSHHWGLHLPSLSRGANSNLHMDIGDFDAFSRPNILY